MPNSAGLSCRKQRHLASLWYRLPFFPGSGFSADADTGQKLVTHSLIFPTTPHKAIPLSRGKRKKKKKYMFGTKQVLACLHYALIFTQCLSINKHSYERLLLHNHTLDCEGGICQNLRMMCTRVCALVLTMISHPGTYYYKLCHFFSSPSSYLL